MSRGYWLSRGDGLFATQKKPWAWDKFAMSLPRRGKNNHTKQFFVPQFECTQQYRAKNIPVEEELDSDTLDELIANVDFNNSTDQQTDDLNKALKRARLDKTLADTKLIGQKLEQRKRQLFYDWSEKFFNCFTQSFGKLKNCLVNMHLNEEQINVFNQTLDSCLNNMQIDLNNIWQEFQQEKEQQNED